MAIIKIDKKQKSPIGSDLSIDLGKFKDFKAYEIGDEVEIEIKAVVVGKHTHDIGSSKERMMDIKITEIECCEEEDATE